MSFNSFAFDSSNHFWSYSPICFFKTSFSVDNSIISSPKTLKAFLIAGIIAVNCSPFLACVDSDYWLKSFKSCIVSFLTVWSKEINCIANSIYIHIIITHSYKSMYTKYNYMYKSSSFIIFNNFV